jgi:MFS family permease
MILTSVITPPAAGLMTTLNINTKVWTLIIYQGLLGFGAGIGFQGPQVAVQTIFHEKDVSIGIAFIQFAQGIGPAVFVTVVQNIFTSRLAANIGQYAPGVDLATLTAQGLTHQNTQVDRSDLKGTVISYDKALTQTFFLPVALSCMSLIGVLGMEWRSVKARKA